MEEMGEEIVEKFVNLWPTGECVETETSSADNMDRELTAVGARQLESPSMEDNSECLGKGGREADEISYEMYQSELQMPDIMKLMKTALSEPYSIYTYRYFIHNWPQLCVLAKCGDRCVGAIVCKLEMHHYNTRRGYIAMLAVDESYRKRKIGKV